MGGGCTPNAPRSSSDSCTLVERMIEKGGKSNVDVVRCDPGEGNMVDGTRNL